MGSLKKPLHRQLSAFAINRRIWRAKSHVTGMPKTAPPSTDCNGVSTGQPIHDQISEAKNRLTAIAPEPNG